MSATSQAASREIRPLVLYEDYTREDVHDVFDPHSPFTPQAGTWGILGIIELPDRLGDFVFFVTFGQKQGEHEFDEGITTEGVFRWQSQPRQDQKDARVRRLITHDPDRNSIQLFLRTAERRRGETVPYTYLGRLRYDGHDRERERPVHFRWALLDWPIPAAVCDRINLRFEGEPAPAGGSANAVLSEALLSAGELQEEDAPPITVETSNDQGETTLVFRALRRRRPADAETRALGLAGERLGMERERRRLLAAGRADLAEKVVHRANRGGRRRVRHRLVASYFADGRTKFVEVKTTTGPKDTDFLITANEVKFSATHRDSYELCRVFLYDIRLNRGHCYSMLGDITKRFQLSATEYRAKL
jgi:hypothetical protein